MTLWQFNDARHAIREATLRAPSVVGWMTGGWVFYDPRKDAPEGVEPEVLVTRDGTVVTMLPLTETGSDVLRSAMRT
jgi:hypothetical protein